MKTVKDNENKMTIVLEDNDEVEIISLKGNNQKLVVKCIDSILHIDEHSKNGFYNEEQKAIDAMKKYLDNE